LTKPTPFGVPVRMIEPGSSVVPWERMETICRTVNIWSLKIGSVLMNLVGVIHKRVSVRCDTVLKNLAIDCTCQRNILRVFNCVR